MSRMIVGARTAVLSLVMFLIPSVARAHTSLKRSEPAKDARLSVAPTAIGLWFTAKPQVPFSRILLLGPGGEIALGPIAADSGNSLHAAITTPLAPGTYTVKWQTASADGHAITGEFAFTVLGAASTTTAAQHDMAGMTAAAANAANPHATVPESAHETHAEYHTGRWLEFVALLTVFGALGFRHGVLPPLAARGVPTSDAADRARRLGVSVLLVYLLAAMTRAYNESVAVHGVAQALVPGQIIPMLTRTIWGIGWILGVVGALLVAGGWALNRRRLAIGTPIALTGAIAMAFAPALSGHAASSAHFVPSVMLDVVHVTAAGLWLGGLLMVLFAGIPAMRRLDGGNTDAAVSALVNSFHPLALFCAPLVVVAGLGTAWLRLTRLSDLWTTDYGLMLTRKTVLVLFVAIIGGYNAIRMRRQLGSAMATRRFRVSGTVELLLAAGVLAFTAWLVTMPVPSEMTRP
jgi:copper transport protein